ncbi:guanine nucleotide binding protein, alpha subunit [Ephemerocybe angulata]|uniref:Guanine nucleotide binding protein, alpha subunit n=1 Tax=Ephemerocybe angulata TaxID=980116 RepID=A0A8H6MA54_9AGAR|nr:guanine nucleotide binding protein, alpha subunit [Tulosesus angulatus]
MYGIRRSKAPKVTWPPAPPVDETDEERQNRLDEEARAKKRSDEIDSEIRAEKEKKKRKPGNRAKILLLGQAESGKSTVLKNFQYQFAPKAFEAEAELWKPIVHLNLVRSINFVINFLNSRIAGMREVMKDAPMATGQGLHFSGDVYRLIASLAPLRDVEDTLNQILAVEPTSGQPQVTGINLYYNPAKAPEGSASSSSADDTPSISDRLWQARRVLLSCGEDIEKLWNDRTVRRALKSAEITLEEQPGFFLDSAIRVTQEDYRPPPQDILKARVTTIGPEEHIIQDERDFDAREWIIYDVGGSRSQRAAWAQFFDDVNIIIFLAPMSAFNQVLAEDESVNRLTDSLKLWQDTCSNKILENLEFVLFLNKLDILQSKLRAGVKFSEFVTSFIDKPNETKPVAKYLLDVFVSIHQKNSPRRRRLHPHLTCAVELILVNFLQKTNVL